MDSNFFVPMDKVTNKNWTHFYKIKYHFKNQHASTKRHSKVYQ